MIYVDTCVIIALIAETDSHHNKAKKIMEYANIQGKEIYTSESVFIKEFIVQKKDKSFNKMSQEDKKEGLKQAREIIHDIFLNKIIPLQENRKVCFKFQDIVIECNLTQKEIEKNLPDINHLAHCLIYNCTQFFTFDKDFKKLLIERNFDFNSNNLEIADDVPGDKLNFPNISTLFSNQAALSEIMEEKETII